VSGPEDSTQWREAIKTRGMALGARAVGIAAAEFVDAVAPPGHRVSDLLPNARAVVVLAGGEPTAGSWRCGSNRVLGSVGYNRGRLGSAARELAYHIEERYGYCALPIPSGNKTGHYPYVSLKLCAEAAGLGTRSLAGGVVLHPEHGLLYFNGVVTTMPVPEDGPLADPVCPQSSCVRMWEKRGVTPCLAACPECLSGEIEKGRIRWMEYRQDRCYPKAQTTAMDAFQKILLEAVGEPDHERRKALLFGSHFTRAVRGLAYSTELSAQCFNCLRRCPVVLRRLRALN